jgi:DNA-binding NarL/FixJ family response regulator
MRIGVIAPNLALRVGVRALLGSGERSAAESIADRTPLFEVVYESASTADFARDSPLLDVLVIAAEVASDASLRQALRKDDARLAILLLSDDLGQAPVFTELPLNGWGILPLDTTAEELQAALRAISEGLVVGTHRLFAPALSRSNQLGGQEAAPLDAPLTERESQVLQLLAHGLANKQIALALSISEHTVKFHVSSIYTKLGANNRTEAVRAGVQRGLVVL